MKRHNLPAGDFPDVSKFRHTLATSEAPLPSPPHKMPRGPLYRLPPIQQGDLLQKLLAVGHFRAEVLRAKMEKRSVDLKRATSKFTIDVLLWAKPPKNVWAIWSQSSPEGRSYEVSEMPWKSIGR